MTRVNLVPAEELTDQHLFAEFRELKMIPKSLARSIRARGLEGVVKMIPAAFTLGKGHVSFFYDKGAYLGDRYERLRIELSRRGVNFDRSSRLDPDGVYSEHHATLAGFWTPPPEALVLIRERIASRIAMKPAWYRMRGKPLEL
jgi:deoxyribonuclease (pyrimidine dimer)